MGAVAVLDFESFQSRGQKCKQMSLPGVPHDTASRIASRTGTSSSSPCLCHLPRRCLLPVLTFSLSLSASC